MFITMNVSHKIRVDFIFVEFSFLFLIQNLDCLNEILFTKDSWTDTRFNKIITKRKGIKNCQSFEFVLFLFLFLSFTLTLNYEFWSIKMRWTWFCLRLRLHIGHFLRVLMTPWMHGAQNKWPHIVDMIWSIVNISKQIGHFVEPIVDFCGVVWLLHDFFADGGPSTDGVVFCGLLSKLSHKSMVASVRYGWRTSVTKITSSSSFGPIGLIVSNCAAPPTNTTLSSRLEFDELGRLFDTGHVAISFNTTRGSRSVAMAGELVAASEAALLSALDSCCCCSCSCCCCDSRWYSPSDAISISALRNSSAVVSSCVSLSESAIRKKQLTKTQTSLV